ncbi:MAG: ribonuclease R [Prevotella sp.]|nr:ribonuclease R [Prevotella sp.]
MSKGKKGGRRINKHELGEMLLKYFSSQPNETFSFKQIFRDLKLNTHPLKMLAIDTMEEMAWDDVLSKVSDTSYRLNTKGQVQEGVFRRKANGKNSFIPDDGGKPIFVSERNSMFALDGDRVRVSMMARRQKHIKEAMVTEILSHARDTVVGQLKVEQDYAFLITEGNIFANDVFIPKRKLKEGKTGDKVVVRIIQWPTRDSKNIVGEVIDVLGKSGDNTVEMHAILAQYGLPYRYPKQVEEAANHIPADITPQDIQEREDYRNVLTFTIDPKDAKDFDDALSIREVEKEEIVNCKLFEVGVHIADVSHYVTEGSIIDKEAQKRATSVYLVDRTIPMLPERLCNNICSLRPDEDKLCYSVIFILDEEANIVSWHLAHTIIRSDRRFAYEEVQAVIDDMKRGVPHDKLTTKTADPELDKKLVDASLKLHAMAQKLRDRRFKSGAVKFESEELHFDIDEKGKPVGCYFKRSLEANQLIEEFMLLANRTVAEAVGMSSGFSGAAPHKVKGNNKRSKTLPYRVHDQPDPTKLENLREFVVRFGYKLKTAGTKGAISKSLNKLMSDVEGTNQQKLIQTVALRAMMKAKYTTHNIGHYGLAFDYYTHFTSPIRRYPDLMVHRLLTRYQNGQPSANRNYYEDQCEHSSDMEQTAQNAERDSIKYKMVEFMGEHIGEEFDAHISGIQSFGIYCEIDENHCEGLVPMRDLDDDYYEFDEKNYCMVGRRRHHKYQLGDPIRIRVARANMDKRQLDFALAD